MAPGAVTTARARALFSPLDARRRAETVARRLVQAITLGLLLDGERLPAESELADQFGVSPVTLRGALATLRAMGLVRTRRGRGGGTFVCAPDEPRPAQLEGMLTLLSAHELRDIGDNRAAIAGAAARLAAERALPADISALGEHAARLRCAGSVTERRRADARLHMEIAATAQSPRLVRAEMELWSEIGDLVRLPAVSAGDVAAIEAEHDELLTAIASQRAELARDLAERHVLRETQRLLALRLRLVQAC